MIKMHHISFSLAIMYIIDGIFILFNSSLSWRSWLYFTGAAMWFYVSYYQRKNGS